MANEAERLLKSLHEKVELIPGKKWWAATIDQVVEGNSEVQFKEAFRRVFAETEKQFKIWTDRASPRKGLGGAPRKVTSHSGKGEAELERLIAAANDAYFNQFNILSGLSEVQFDHMVKKMNVDLIEVKKNKVTKMIELKDKDNQENPFSALIQLMSYYYLFLLAHGRVAYGGMEYPDLARNFCLQVLAPREYYKRFKANCLDLIRIAKIAEGEINRDGRRLRRTKGKVEFLTFSRTDDDLKKTREDLKKALREFDKRMFIPLDKCE